MTPALYYAVLTLSVAAVIWGCVTAVTNKPPGKAQLIFAAIVELVTLVQSLVALTQIALGFRPVELATTVGYLIALVVLIPVAWFWANNERTRWSGVVLAVAAFSVMAMTLRLDALWVPA